MDTLFNHDAWDVACLFDGAGNVLQWNTLIGEDTGFTEELITQDTTNSSYQSGTTQQMMLASSDYDGLDMLTGWKQAKTPLRAVALSFQQGGRNCRWTEPTSLQEMTDQPRGTRSDGDSYLRAYLQAHDAEAQRYQNLMHNVDGDIITLPIAGVSLTLSAERSVDFTLEMEVTDYSGQSLKYVSKDFNGGRGSLEIIMPPNSWKIEVIYYAANNVSLRADGGTEYIAG